jgi:CRP-like cAMP-binding protein
MYDTLLQLPLFQGLSQADFVGILGKVKLHFTKFEAGKLILPVAGEHDHLTFLLRGEVSVQTAAAGKRYTLTEYLPAPALLEPHTLFGMHPVYDSNYKAHTLVHLVDIDKPTLTNELLGYDIFRLNLLNLISNRAQVYASRLWEEMPDDPQKALLQFVLHRCDHPRGAKLLRIYQSDLSTMLRIPRLTLSAIIHRWQENGWIENRRGSIYFPNIERILL